MKKYIFSAILIAFFITLFSLDYVPNEIIIKTKKHRAIRSNTLGLKDLDNYLSTYGVKKIKPVIPKRDNRYYVAVLNKNISKSELKNLHFKGVDYIQPNYINKLYKVPNDPGYVHQQLYLINAPKAWDYTEGNKDIIVGLVDSGIHLNHPDLLNNIYVNQKEITQPEGYNLDSNNDNYISLPELIQYFTDENLDLNNDGYINSWDIINENSPVLDHIDNDENGYVDDILGWDFVDAPELSAIALGDYINPDNNPEDENNHGTHVGGIIAADTNNGIGIAGVNWHTKLLIARAGFQTTASQGYLQDDDAAAAVIYAVDNGANVINASWGDYVFSQIISDACQYAYDKGCIVCVASGNTYSPGVMYPAKLTTTIAVGAANEQKEVADLTSWGPELDLIAPGIGIYSTLSDGIYSDLDMYSYMSGTSMAAPFVSGAVALLLSIQPNLDFAQVKAKLYRSSEDVGDPGFDNHTGAGFLDVYKLILDTNSPYINVTYPPSFATLSSDFNILGTVNIPDFFKYSVMYSKSQIPTTTDWSNVNYPHTNTPHYYYEPVLDSTIAKFDVDETILDSLYLIKIDVQSKTNEHYTYFTNVNIDRTAPVILDSLTFLQERYDDETLKFFMKVSTDEPSYVTVTLRNAAGSYQASSDITASTQSILLPDIPDGNYNIDIKATNLANLTSNVTLPYLYNIKNRTVDINSYTETVVGDEKIYLNKTRDLDGNRKTDFVACNPLSNNSAENALDFYEINGDDFNLKRSFNYSIYPQDMGNTSGHGVDIIGKEHFSSNGYHYVNNSNSFYPDRLFTVYDTLNLGANPSSYYSGNFIDFNNDGIDDIAIKTFGPVYKLFVRDQDNIEYVTEMYDNTPYEGQINQFSLKIKAALLDRNSKMDIVAGDTDGDVMVFEYSEGDTLLLPVWSVRLGFPNISNIAIGNFKRNTFNRKQFCVGGYYKDFIDPKNSYSYFIFFETNGTDHEYIPFGGIGFTNVNPPNYISSADIDGDGFDELVVLVSPNIYIVKYIDGKFVAIWNGKADAKNSNSLAVIPKTEGEEAAIMANKIVDGELKSILIKKAEPFYGPPTPENFRYNITRNKAVKLSWDNGEDISFYKIYRKKINSEYTCIDSVYHNNSYIDSTVANKDTLYYRITAVSNLFHPNESLPTHEKFITIDDFPAITYIGMDSSNRLKIIFDKKLANTSFSVGNYFVNNNIGHPISANQIQNQFGVLLTFTNVFSDPQENDLPHYEITISNVKSKEGMPFYYQHDSDANVIPFDFSNDTTPPHIKNVNVLSTDKFSIVFSESMNKQEVENPYNYLLTPPLADKDNSIKTINYVTSTNSAEVTLMHKANSSNQMYFLKISDIHDLSGNIISNDGNKISFLMNPINKIGETKVGPNPFHIDRDGILKFFLPLGKKATIRIMNLNGDLVYKANIEPLSEFKYFYSWNGKNLSGNVVGSGIYYYIIKMGNDIKKGKFVVIK